MPSLLLYPTPYLLCLHSPELAVEGAILDGFGDMRHLDRVCAGEIGDGASHFEQTVVSAGGEAKLLNGRTEQALHLLRRRAIRSDFSRPHLRVAEERTLGLDARQGIRVRRKRLVGGDVGRMTGRFGFFQSR